MPMALYSPSPRTVSNAYAARPSPCGSVQQHASMVQRIARQMLQKLPANIELDDLVQVGMMGLVDAMQRFDAEKDVQFETFATTRIRGAMLDNLRNADWAPRSLRKQQKELTASIQKLEHALGRPPKDSELAAHMGLELQELQLLKYHVQTAQMTSLECLSAEDSDESYLSKYVSNECSVQDVLEKKQERILLLSALQTLTEREQYIMSMYYEHEMKLKEIGSVLDLTESRVSQILSQCIIKIKKKSFSNV